MSHAATHQSSSASELADAIRNRYLSAVDVVEEQLDRIATYNSALNAIVTLDADGARRRASEADRALGKGVLWGQLHGVPITIKDSFDTAGIRTTSGYRPFARRVPLEDATPVARLREAGAIILGKTNVPTFASGIQTNNPVFGRLKTTAGRVAGKGHVASARRLEIPVGFEALLELASFGPIARSLDDLQLALPIISEPSTPSLHSAKHPVASELRLAWTDDFGGTPLDQDSRRLMKNLEEALVTRGGRIERIPAAIDYDEAWHVAGTCLGAINTLFQSSINRWARYLVSPILLKVGPRRPVQRGLFMGMALNFNRIRGGAGSATSDH